MPVKVVDADIEKDLDLFVAILNRNRRIKVGRNRFEWLYLNNPQGKARAWFVQDETTGDTVAFTSVLPRLIKVEGRDLVCWNCCDFSVDRRYRALGVALKLRRKAKECVDNGEIPALFAHPNDRMKVIHEKVGHYRIGQMERFAKILRANQQVEKIVKNKFLARLLTPGANLFLRVTDKAFKINKRYDVRWIENEDYGEEYDRLFRAVSNWHRIIGDRGASYLNWRYGQNPLYSTDRIVIRDNGNLVGYIIFYVKNGVAVFKDILCIPDENILNTLLGQWVKMLRERRTYSISAIFMDKNPMVRSLQYVGFRRRPEVSSVYAYAQGNDAIQPVWLNGTNWYMTVGDRDV